MKTIHHTKKESGTKGCERRAKSAAGAGRKVRHLWANEGDSWRKVKRGGGRSPLCAGLREGHVAQFVED